MNKEFMYDIIRSPLVTEKSSAASEHNKVTFKVSIDATKSQIKKSVEFIFGVKVTGVNTINVLGKEKIFKGRKGKRNDFKKAIVTIAEGQTIDMTAGV